MTSRHPFIARAQALGRPLVLGHRGASIAETENTMEAFSVAREVGADGVELDVRLCATGEVVVFHDQTLSRLAGRGERVASMPWCHLREVTIGRDRRIPTLERVLTTFAASTFVVNVEIKSDRTGRAGPLVDRVLDCIARCQAVESVVLSSFDPLVLGRVHRKAPRLATGFLFHRDAPLAVAHAWRVPPFQPTALHPQHALITSARMLDWARRGLAVLAWTVDDLGEVRRLTDLGVHAIITNDPARVRPSFG